MHNTIVEATVAWVEAEVTRLCAELAQEQEKTTLLTMTLTDANELHAEVRADLDAAEAALADCGSRGIYTDFDGPADAIMQMAARIEKLEDESMIKAEIASKEMAEALQTERQLRQEAERQAKSMKQRAEKLHLAMVRVHRALDKCKVRATYEDNTHLLAGAEPRISWLNERAEKAEAANDHLRSAASQVPYLKDRAERAEALAKLVTPDLATLLESLATHVPYTLHAGIGIATQARALAAQIREALDDSQA